MRAPAAMIQKSRLPETPEQRDHEGKEEIILFLDAETPSVEKRFFIIRGIEIAAVFPKKEVGNEAGNGDQTLREIPQLFRKHRVDSEQKQADRTKNSAGRILRTRRS